MSTQPIGHKQYSFTYRKPAKSGGDAEFSLTPEQSKIRQKPAESTPVSARDRIRALLADIPLREGGKLSFLDVKTYRDDLELDWDARVSGDLAAMGVEVGRNFRLTHDPTAGGVVASPDHPDKAKIDMYFQTDAEAADDFKSLLQLGKLVDVAERRLSPADMETRLSPEAMSWWFDSNMDATSLLIGGGLVFGMPGAAYQGLDITV